MGKGLSVPQNCSPAAPLSPTPSPLLSRGPPPPHRIAVTGLCLSPLENPTCIRGMAQRTFINVFSTGRFLRGAARTSTARRSKNSSWDADSACSEPSGSITSAVCTEVQYRGEGRWGCHTRVSLTSLRLISISSNAFCSHAPLLFRLMAGVVSWDFFSCSYE